MKFYIGSFEDDFTLKQFRTLCLQIRPAETVVPSNLNEKSESIMILKNSPLPPSITFTSMQDLHDEERLIQKIAKYLGENHS